MKFTIIFLFLLQLYTAAAWKKLPMKGVKEMRLPQLPIWMPNEKVIPKNWIIYRERVSDKSITKEEIFHFYVQKTCLDMESCVSTFVLRDKRKRKKKKKRPIIWTAWYFRECLPTIEHFKVNDTIEVPTWFAMEKRVQIYQDKKNWTHCPEVFKE